MSVCAQDVSNSPSIQWSLTPRGVLNITGNGAMKNYAVGETPWYSMRDNIKTIIIDEGVTSIGSCAFADCKHLSFIVFSQSLQRIENRAFYNCGEIASITIPQNVVQIGSEAFSKCTSLQRIVLPAHLEEIADGLFDKCTALSAVSIPNNVTRIGTRAFASCKALQDCIIPLGVTSIGSAAFAECTALKDIIVPDTVKRIESETFYKCSQLERAVLGNSIQYIGDEAFCKCSRLANFYCLSLTVPKVEGDPFCNKGKKVTMWVLNTRYFSMHEYWKTFQLKGEDKDEPYIEPEEEEPVAEPAPEPTPEPALKNNAYTITASNLNVRKAASPQAASVGSVHRGDTVYIEDIENETWGKILYKGQTAYVSTKFLQKIEEGTLIPAPNVTEVVTMQQPIVVSTQTTTPTDTASTVDNKPKTSQFEMYYEFLSVAVGKAKGSKVGCNLGGDFQLGMRSASKRNFIGVGVGLHAYIIGGGGYLYMPMYATDKFYLTVGRPTNLVLDVALGGYVNLMYRDPNGDDHAGDGGGFFMRTGVAFDYHDSWQIGAGYQMFFEKDVEYAVHAGYIKLVFRF